MASCLPNLFTLSSKSLATKWQSVVFPIVLCGGFGDCSFVREAVHLHTLVHHCMGVRVVLGCHGYGARLRADLHKVFLKAKGFKSYALQACGLQRGLWKSYVLEALFFAKGLMEKLCSGKLFSKKGLMEKLCS